MEQYSSEIQKTLAEFDQQQSLFRAHTTPVGVRYEDGWEFFVKSDATPLNGDPIETVCLFDYR